MVKMFVCTTLQLLKTQHIMSSEVNLLNNTVEPVEGFYKRYKSKCVPFKTKHQTALNFDNSKIGLLFSLFKAKFIFIVV